MNEIRLIRTIYSHGVGLRIAMLKQTCSNPTEIPSIRMLEWFISSGRKYGGIGMQINARYGVKITALCKVKKKCVN